MNPEDDADRESYLTQAEKEEQRRQRKREPFQRPDLTPDRKPQPPYPTKETSQDADL